MQGKVVETGSTAFHDGIDCAKKIGCIDYDGPIGIGFIRWARGARRGVR